MAMMKYDKLSESLPFTPSVIRLLRECVLRGRLPAGRLAARLGAFRKVESREEGLSSVGG